MLELSLALRIKKQLMKISFVKKSVVLALVSIALFSFRMIAPANFSGTWSLNEGKSDLGQFGARGVATKIVVDQKTDAVTITRSSTSFQGEPVTLTETLAEGKEVSGNWVGTSKRKATLKWAADQQSFTISSVITFEMNGNSFDLKGTEVWTVSTDGKALTLANTVTTPQGEFSIKALYDKQ